MDKSQIIRAWAERPVQLLDIRRIELRHNQEALSYRLPAHMFLLSAHGQASLMLDDLPDADTRDQLLHGNKGARLRISPISDRYVCYFIFYRPVKPREISEEAADHGDVGHAAYRFRAQQPWELRRLAERMHQLWTDGGELEKIQTSGMFYQFVHEQFRQWRIEDAHPGGPDLAESIERYLRGSYRDAISMDSLAGLFHYSTHYIVRVFKRKFGCSPLAFLVTIRMEAAKELLADTEASIREIAENVGYEDLSYFNKTFKKQTGVTPVQFKMRVLGSKGSNRTSITSKSFIASLEKGAYTINSDNHYQQNLRGVDEVQFTLKPYWTAGLLLTLSLLLAACGESGTSEGAAGGAAAESVPPAESANETRIYTDALDRQVEIPASPSKVVVVTYGGYLLPLGLLPVGVDQGTLDQYPEEMADVESIGAGIGDKETILSLQPDLIIVPDYWDPAKYANYEKIAPTIAVAWGGDPDVINTLRTMGDIMNRKTEAEAWIAKFEAKLQRIRDGIDMKLEPGTKATSFVYYQGEFLMGGEGGTLGKLIYEDYGFELPDQLKPFADGGTVLTEEAFASQPVDYYFTQMNDDEMVEFGKLIEEPVYQAIPAVKNKRIINVSRDMWNYGPYLVDQATDALIEQMNKLQ